MKYKIKTITPVVISSGKTLTRLDYVKRKDYLYVVNIDRLMDFLESNNCEKLSESLIKSGDFEKAVKEVGLDEEILAKCWKYRVRCHFEVKEGIKSLIRDPRHMVYIPASSIKGSVRTALLYHVFKEQSVWDKFSEEIRIKLNLYFQHKKRLKPKMLSRMLNGILTKYFTGKLLKEAPHYDPLRFLKFGDSKPLSFEGNVEVFPVCMVKVVDENAKKCYEYPLTFVEGFVPNVSFEGKFSLDRLLTNDVYRKKLKEFKNLILVSSLEKICEAINGFSSSLVEAELEFFGKYGIDDVTDFYRELKEKIKGLGKKEALIKLGWGSGYFSVTLGLLFKRKDLRLFTSIKKFKRLGKPGIKEFPSTRKLVKYEGRYLPLGWAKLELET